MSKDNFEEIALQLVRKTYVNQGVQNLSCRDKKLEQLMTQKKIPDIGMDDQLIEYILDKFASMDSNNFESNVGVGEREGRVYSSLVLRRSYYLSHGIGRSGDIAEEQPKAAGSSIIYKLTNSMATHALELAGFMKNTNCLVLPLATGMALTLCMTTLRQQNPSAIYVIFSRIDQKSCFKSISTAALIPLVVDHLIIDGELQTDLKKIEELLEIYGNKVLCVLSTTSCFAPRQPDSVDKIAQICKVRNVGHIINNAYGLQCKSITKLINRAFTIGRVDAGKSYLLFHYKTSYCCCIMTHFNYLYFFE